MYLNYFLADHVQKLRFISFKYAAQLCSSLGTWNFVHLCQVFTFSIAWLKTLRSSQYVFYYTANFRLRGSLLDPTCSLVCVTTKFTNNWKLKAFVNCVFSYRKFVWRIDFISSQENTHTPVYRAFTRVENWDNSIVFTFSLAEKVHQLPVWRQHAWATVATVYTSFRVSLVLNKTK